MNNVPFNNFNNLNFQTNFSSNKAAEIVDTPQDKIVNQNVVNQTTSSQIQNIKIFSPFIFEQTELQNKEVLTFMQNTMELPETVEKILYQLVKEVIANNSKENSNNMNSFLDFILSLNEINAKLGENSKIAMDKILKMIVSSSKSGMVDTKQLEKLFSILKNINQNQDTSLNTLRELFLLYIPIEPLVFDRKVLNKTVIDNQSEITKNATISVMLQTINFANILCVINEQNDKLLIDLYANELFPNLKSLKIIEEYSKQINLTIETSYIKIPTKEIDNKEQNFHIESKDFIQVKEILISYLIIKTIFYLDYCFNKTDLQNN